MSAVEIDQAACGLADQPFDPETSPFEFLRAFGYMENRIRLLNAGETDKSDVGGVLHAKEIHIPISPPNEAGPSRRRLRESSAIGRRKTLCSRDGCSARRTSPYHSAKNHLREWPRTSELRRRLSAQTSTGGLSPLVTQRPKRDGPCRPSETIATTWLGSRG